MFAAVMHSFIGQLFATEWAVLLCYLLAAALIWGSLLAVYRLYFSPLAKFPGSKIAAATSWYEFYYDVIKPGQYFRHIAHMHELYGPIIRITPWELSINDGSFYNTIYVSSAVRRTMSYKRYMAGMGIDGSIPVSYDHDLHRMRRKPLDPFFSKRGALAFEPIILAELAVLEQRFLAIGGTPKIVNIENVYSALTGDIIAKISISPKPLALVSDPNFSPNWEKTVRGFFAQLPTYTHLTFLMGWMRFVPLTTLLYVWPGAAAFRSFVNLVTDHIKDSKQRRSEGNLIADERTNTLVEHLLLADLPEQEKSTARLTGEFVAILAGGTGTSARALATITYFVLANSELETRLRESLVKVMNGYPNVPPKVTELEKIPLLAACIKEGLRISHGTMRRVPRCAQDDELRYNEWVIPKGTPVGISPYLMHTNTDIFPEPFKFLPDRWLDGYNPKMDKHWVPFLRGSRSCLGMHLAIAELYLTLAAIFRPDGPRMSLHETDETDVVPCHDFFLALPKLNSKGVRVTFH